MRRENFEEVIKMGRARRRREQDAMLSEWVKKLRNGEEARFSGINERERMEEATRLRMQREIGVKYEVFS